jgi:hypothetical protein
VERRTASGSVAFAAFQQVHQAEGLVRSIRVLLVVLALFRQPFDEVAHVQPFRLRGPVVLRVVQPFLVADGGQEFLQQAAGGFLFGAEGDAVDEVAELHQRFQLPGGEVGLEGGFVGGLEQADVALAGVVAEPFQGGGADAPARRGDGADEGGIVVLVGDQAQVGVRSLISDLSKNDCPPESW